ncbi:MAG: TatD family hydrolase [Gemmatimonadota bacterium]|jgi:TatD DNase family protein|nr:TatD family hydrolase [Gemmatimonadota bacterium]
MNPPELIDTHAHLTDERLIADVAGILQRAHAAGVGGVVTVGTEVESSREAVRLTERFPQLRASVGIHPHSASTADDAAWEQLRELALHPRVVALGETGLDFHYDFAPRAVQRAVFERHLEWSRESGLPVVVHCREAEPELAAMLRAAGRGTTGVLHSFNGDAALLEQALEIGWYASFSGMITFRKWSGAALLRAVPADRVLVETDSPYLAPVPFRGRTNEPAWVAQVALRAAELRGEDPWEFAAATRRNAQRFFSLEDSPPSPAA